jgi:hypothetical protein
MASTEEIKIADNQSLPAGPERKARASQDDSPKTGRRTFESRADYDWMDHALPFSSEHAHI